MLKFIIYAIKLAIIVPFLATAWAIGEVCHLLRRSEVEKKERWRADF